jgi:TetR/AcrR family fatty acid metabolism transcriptional regulator
MKAVMDSVLRLINEGQEEGLIRNDMDGHVIRDLLLGILEHRVTRWVLKEGKYDLLENYGRICDFALVGRLK